MPAKTIHFRIRLTGALVIFAAFVLPLSAPSSRAEDKPAEPQTIKHRVTGLFSPDRVADLGEAVKKIPDMKLISVDFRTAEATFQYNPEKVFNKPKPEEIPERFDNLLKSVSNHTFGIRPLSTVPKEKLTLVEIPIVGLDCKACSLAAYEAVYKIEGVEQATASFSDGLVTAQINPEKTTRAKLEEALKQRNVTLKP